MKTIKPNSELPQASPSPEDAVKKRKKKKKSVESTEKKPVFDPTWQKNAKHTVEILGYNGEGAGVARVEGRVIFIPDTIKGEIWEIILVKVQKSYAHGKAMECVQASPQRVEKDCRFAEKCGGCQLRHMSYEEELRLKEEIITSAFQRIGGISTEIAPVLGAEEQNHYRNKVQFQVSGNDKWLKVGFYRARSHQVLDVDSCFLQKDFSTIARTVLKTWMAEHHVNPYDEETGKGTIRHLFLRSNEAGDILLCLVATRQKLPQIMNLLEAFKEALPQLKGFILNVNKKDTNVVLGEEYHKIWGEDNITERLCGMDFTLSLSSFFQVNLKQTEVLYQTVKDFAELSAEETILDLYCGTGTIGLSMAKEAKKVYGLEIVPEAVEDAKRNALQNGIDNSQFFLGDCNSLQKEPSLQDIDFDLVIVDPPRKGLQNPEEILSYVSKKLIYVSCDPGTLARDLKYFTEHGLQVRRVQPVDLFPRTKHVECVVLLEKTQA